MSIENFYSLTSKKIEPKNLMLDANNPRISWGAENGEYPTSEICRNATQAALAEELKKDRHKLKVLVQSIATKGFINNLAAIIVRKVEGSEKYIVLEGNRRIAAVRLLMSNEASASIKSIQKLPVQVFEYVPNDRYSEQDVIDVLLGTIHIGGPEGWSAMRKAQFVLKSYRREYLEKYPEVEILLADKRILSGVADNFNLKAGNVRSMIGAAQVFEQMCELDLPVEDDDYSLIEVATSKTQLRERIFEFDTNTMTMSENGLYTYSSLCLEDGATITNPKEMDALSFVVSKGTQRDLSRVLDREVAPSEVKSELKTNENTTAAKLEKIYQTLEGISVSELAGLNSEGKLTASNLAALVDHKFKHFIKS